MASKHTPGPWTFKKIGAHPNHLVYCLIGDPHSLKNMRGVAFAGVYPKLPVKGTPLASPKKISEEETLANANLISAAPELLALAHGYEQHLIRTNSSEILIELVRNIIAKAEGAHANQTKQP